MGGHRRVSLPKGSRGAGVRPGGLAVPAGEGFRVIETFGWDGRRFPRLKLHLARLGRTCAVLGIGWEPMEVLVRLDALPDAGPLRVRVTVDRAGRVAVTHGAVLPVAQPWRVGVADQRLASGDPWLRVKTSERGLYDAARAELVAGLSAGLAAGLAAGPSAGLDEVIFANERGEICEGAITTVFFDAGAGLCTPPLTCGLLPGVLREEMLAAGQCREAVLRLADLAGVTLLLGNSLRGLVPATLTGRGAE